MTNVQYVDRGKSLPLTVLCCACFSTGQTYCYMFLNVASQSQITWDLQIWKFCIWVYRWYAFQWYCKHVNINNINDPYNILLPPITNIKFIYNLINSFDLTVIPEHIAYISIFISLWKIIDLMPFILQRSFCRYHKGFHQEDKEWEKGEECW